MWRVLNWLRARLPGHELHVWHSPDYRFPLPLMESRVGFETRRADLALWSLVAQKLVRSRNIHRPRKIRYADLGLVHTEAYLESMDMPGVLAGIFGADAGEIPATEVVASMRLACGGTLSAARHAWRHSRPTFNLLGGFHHAWPDRGGGFCPFNDIAVAVAALRLEGFEGKVRILDLDAHPPDGLAACFEGDARVWIGSLSGADWGPLPGVDETVLPTGCGDEPYLEALRGLLSRAPDASLSFVIASGDVLAGDRFGGLGLTLDGARRRDLMVAEALEGQAVVWLPGGGYNEDAWRVLAGTGMAVVARSRRPLPSDHHPMSLRFARISASLQPEDLQGDDWLTEADLFEALGGSPQRRARLLGYYTPEGLELALSRLGILRHLRRLGYDSFRVALGGDSSGERLQLWGQGGGEEHLLIEAVLERQTIGQTRVLYVHWLTLRHPMASFNRKRPRLPGQEVPGLGLAQECGVMLARMAERLELAGVAFRPAHYHVAYSARSHFVFVDPARQGRFEALIRDLAGLSLLEATAAVHQGRVLLDGEVYTWEAEPMIFWIHEPPGSREAAAEVCDRTRFELVSPAREET